MELPDFYPWALVDSAQPVRHLTVESRAALGAEAREHFPYSRLGAPFPREGRPDPVQILEDQALTRVAELLPIRYGRMAASPFAMLRGSAAVMASDLGRRASSPLTVQLCGDAHLSNFGVFGTPERELIFDVNDFDETYPGPFEWDLIRVAASAVVAARSRSLDDAVAHRAAVAVAAAYRTKMRALSVWGNLPTWYDKVTQEDVESVAADVGTKYLARTEETLAKARLKSSLQAAGKMTTIVDGHRRFVDDPPLVVRPDLTDDEFEAVAGVLREYRASLISDRRVLLQRYRLRDLTRKVVGVGSVGTRAWVLLMEGRDVDDVVLLQAKEANESVLERHVPIPDTIKPVYTEQGHRVVHGQRVMQAASDLFLGWAPGPLDRGRHYYIRQLRDMKGSIDMQTLRPKGLVAYAGLCGATLAQAHARGGDSVAIAAYVGKGDGFDQAILSAALDYAELTAEDHEALLVAIGAGRIPARTGV